MSLLFGSYCNASTKSDLALSYSFILEYAWPLRKSAFTLFVSMSKALEQFKMTCSNSFVRNWHADMFKKQGNLTSSASFFSA